MNKAQKITGSLLVAVALLGSPVFVSANEQAACFAGVAVVDGIVQNVRNAQEKIVRAYRNERVRQIDAVLAETEKTLGRERSKQDNERKRLYTRLAKQAKTTEQKGAVSEFQENIETLAEVRYNSVDEAISSFKDGVTMLASDFDTGIDEIVATHKASIDNAVSEAKDQCKEGQTKKQVGNYLKAELNTAEKAAKDIHNEYNIVARYQALQKERDDRIESAVSVFLGGFAEEAHILRQAF